MANRAATPPRFALRALTKPPKETLGLALVARPDLSGARYVPLCDAPSTSGDAGPYLAQLHAIAGTEVQAAPRTAGFRTGQWSGRGPLSGR